MHVSGITSAIKTRVGDRGPHTARPQEHQLPLAGLSLKLPTTVLLGAHPPRRKSVQVLKRVREMSKDTFGKNSQDTLLSAKNPHELEEQVGRE